MQLMCPCRQRSSDSLEVAPVFRVSVPTMLAAYRFAAPSLAFAVAGLGGLRFADLSEKIAFPGLSSLDLALLFRVPLHRCRRWRGEPRLRLPPLRFLPLRRFPDPGQLLLPEGTSFRLRALSAFLTLSGPCSARDLPALFHAGPALGVLPFRVDLHSQSRTSFRMPLPSWGSRLDVTAASTTLAAVGIGVPLATTAVFLGGGAFADPLLFRALLPASVHFSEPIV
jgi:hypothetical protein